MDLAVIGRSEFVVGFQLAGINRVVELDGAPGKAEEAVKTTMADSTVGIILLDEEVLQELPERTRDALNTTVNPVVVVLSTQSSQDTLRKMIRKSIGVDLWGE